MHKRKPILIDVDGVCLDWVWGFREYLQGEGVYLNGYRPETFTMEQWTGLSRDQILAHIATFNRSAAFGELKAVEGAVPHLKMLAEAGYPIIAISSCSDNEMVIARRKRNLTKVFGEIFFRIHCLGLGESKGAILREHFSAWWIEDRWEGALEGCDAGHESILLHWPYNDRPTHPDICRCLSWGQIHQTILWAED